FAGLFLLIFRCANMSTLFPYTTLFRSSASSRAKDPNPEDLTNKPYSSGDKWIGIVLLPSCKPSTYKTGQSLPRFSTIPSQPNRLDRKSTRLNSSHVKSTYAVFCWKKKK